MASDPANRVPDHSVTGDGDTTLFLLHGAYGAKEYWRNQLAVFSRAGFRVVAWDCPGYGLSPLPADFSIEFAARAFIRLFDREATRRNVVLGHSMGGMVAQRVVAYAPERINALILSATGPAFGSSDGEWQREFVRQRVAPLDAGRTIAQYAPDMLRAMMGAGVSSPDIDRVIDVVSEMPEPTFRAAIAAITRFDGRDTLHRLKDVPTLCLAGGLDATAPAKTMARMAERIGAEFHCFETAGHFAWAEEPDAFNEAVLGFVGRLSDLTA